MILSPNQGVTDRPFFIGVRKRSAVLVVATSVFLAFSSAYAKVPAFPGAEGGGALAAGGRAGFVCPVTNVNDSGPGSLRECVEMEGPRTVTFRVGGTIVLQSPLHIVNPYITIAGQTAPGGGIQLIADKGAYATSNPLINVRADHVVVRYLRLRKGFTNNKAGNVRVMGSDVIFDHVSMYWSLNQNWSLYTWGTSGPKNVTLQNSIVAEMLDRRVNILIGASNSAGAASMTDIDMHNNLLANTGHRNPSAQQASGRFVNNIFYNWSAWASRSIGGVQHDWISNLWKPGPANKKSSGQQELQFIQSHRGDRVHENVDRIIHGHPSAYVAGNRGGQSGMEPDTDNWAYTRETGKTDDPTLILNNGDAFGPTPGSWRRTNPLPRTPIPIIARHVDELENHLLPIVGASRRLDCSGNWVSNRDVADERLITEYWNNEGIISSSGEGEEIYGGFPALATGVACEDTSGDGVPDQWARANGLDHTDPTLGGTMHDSGYTYLEMYLSGMQVSPAKPEQPSGVLVQ